MDKSTSRLVDLSKIFHQKQGVFESLHGGIGLLEALMDLVRANHELDRKFVQLALQIVTISTT